MHCLRLVQLSKYLKLIERAALLVCVLDRLGEIRKNPVERVC